jgi:hypothetical protein
MLGQVPDEEISNLAAVPLALVMEARRGLKAKRHADPDWLPPDSLTELYDAIRRIDVGDGDFSAERHPAWALKVAMSGALDELTLAAWHAAPEDPIGFLGAIYPRLSELGAAPDTYIEEFLRRDLPKAPKGCIAAFRCSLGLEGRSNPREEVEGELVDRDANPVARREPAAVARTKADRLQLYSQGHDFDRHVVAQDVRRHIGTMLFHAFEVGRLLCWAKAALPHGQFGPWVEREFNFSKMTRARYMGIADMLLDRPKQLEILKGAPIKSVLLLTTLPDDQVELLMADGKLGDVELTDFAKKPFREIKALLDGERKARAHVEDELQAMREQRDAANEKVREVERHAARASGLVPPEELEAIIETCADIEERFTTVNVAISIRIENLARQAPHLGVKEKAQIAGLVVYMDRFTTLMRARAEELWGHPWTGAEWTDLLGGPRPLADVYTFPEHMVPPTFGDDDDGMEG